VSGVVSSGLDSDSRSETTDERLSRDLRRRRGGARGTSLSQRSALPSSVADVRLSTTAIQCHAMTKLFLQNAVYDKLPGALNEIIANVLS